MTTTYHFKGQDWTADTLVHALHKGSRARAADDAAWMTETAHRIKVQNGHQIRVDTSNNFLDDVIKLDLLNGLAGD